MTDTDAEGDERRSGEDEMSEAEIDMNLVQTFPASDSPSWTLGIDRRAKSRVTNESDSSGKKPNASPPLC